MGANLSKKSPDCASSDKETIHAIMMFLHDDRISDGITPVLSNLIKVLEKMDWPQLHFRYLWHAHRLEFTAMTESGRFVFWSFCPTLESIPAFPMLMSKV
jgi:hypothetical protein